MVRTGVLLTLLAIASPARHFEVAATFEPARKAGANAAVAVTFRALDPDVHVNETPAPQLRLDLAQTVLEDRQPKAPMGVPDYDPLTARYLDLQKPVRFAVGISKAAPHGAHEVKASVVFFYCSSREAWCRRGSADVVIPVSVR
ncbi:MAG: hypothetical protein ACHP85_11815 [Burkholderiales bacterium]|jgi:hypothetical protein